MKKTLLLLLTFCVFTNTFSSSAIKSPFIKASEIFVPIGKDLKISLMDLSVITVKDFQKITGKHLNFIDKWGFKQAQRKLRNSINNNGTINNKKLQKLLDSGDPSTGFHLGGFALGFLLGLLGVLIAYIIGGDEDIKRNRAKWAWIGCGVIVLIELILIIAIIGAIGNN